MRPEEIIRLITAYTATEPGDSESSSQVSLQGHLTIAGGTPLVENSPM